MAEISMNRDFKTKVQTNSKYFKYIENKYAKDESLSSQYASQKSSQQQFKSTTHCFNALVNQYIKESEDHDTSRDEESDMG